MKRALTAQQAIALLRKHIEAEGSQKAFAEKRGISRVEVSQVLNGRRQPSKAVMQALGLERATVYLEREK
jgi:DNA-binding transcriptional regulator YdaS (Cro superfamily)